MQPLVGAFSLPATACRYLKPYVHFIPVRMDYSDLPAQLDWARANEPKVLEIASNAAHLAGTRLTIPHLLAYLYRVIIEYQRLYNDDQ